MKISGTTLDRKNGGTFFFRFDGKILKKMGKQFDFKKRKKENLL